MLEALLLGSLANAASPLTQAAPAPPKPSLELLEFLGEFGDDEEGLLDDVASTGKRPDPPAAPEEPPTKTPPASKEAK